jgi:hypothetical protein
VEAVIAAKAVLGTAYEIPKESIRLSSEENALRS